MSTHVRARLGCVALLVLFATPARAEPLTIDLATAVARARERAPAAVASLGRIAEARAQRAGATVLFTQNPELELGAGPRYGARRTLALDGQLSQPLELGRRGARIEAADAAIARARAAGEAELRALAFEAATLFFEARFADLMAELAERNQDVAARAAEAAARRRAAGDVTDLDVNLARIALGRARSQLAQARSERAERVGRLATVIGAQPGDAITLAGDLRPAAVTLEALRAAVGARADVRALAAEASEARAEGALARAQGRPDLGLWAGYQRDEDDTIVMGGITVTLPLWNRAQGERAVARAKERRAELERAAVASAASRQVVDAFEAYARAREAVEVFERDVLPALADSEQLLERSIETGQITINDYLVARQQLLDARREHLERQLRLAHAAAAARFVAGGSP